MSDDDRAKVMSENAFRVYPALAQRLGVVR